MDPMGYPYPTSAFGTESIPGKEFFPRVDAHLSMQALCELLEADADRWLVEWTYRVTDHLDNVADSGEFMEDLMKQYLCARGVPLRTSFSPKRLGHSEAALVEFAVGLFRRGQQTLADTCKAIRCGIAGHTYMTEKIFPDQPDPHKHALANAMRYGRGKSPGR